MKIRALSAILFSLVSIVSASAATVTFSTGSSNFNGSGTSVNFGNVRLTYLLPTPDPQTVTTPSSPNFGILELSCPTNNCTTNDLTNTFSGTFNLVISQTAPSVGNGTLSGTLSGALSLYNGVASITWGSSILNIGTIRYTLSQTTLNLTTASVLNPAPTALPTGRTTIQGQVIDATIPEPSTYAMLGSALLGLGLLRRRK